MTITSNETKNFNLCPECQGNLISIESIGDIVCNQCGLVVNERELRISHNETRSYNKEQKEKKERVGTPISPLIPDLGLTTVINKNEIINENLKRAVKLNNYLSWEKQNLVIATTELRRIKHNLNLPLHVASVALKLYKDAYRLKLIKGRSIQGMITACIYYACRIKKIPRTFGDVLNESQVSEKKLKGCYTTLVKELNLRIPIVNPVALIPRYIAELGLDFEIEKLTVKILESYFKSNSIRGTNPKGICAGAIYLASKFKNKCVSQKVISDTIGITDSTLRSRYKEILSKINLRILNNPK